MTYINLLSTLQLYQVSILIIPLCLLVVAINGNLIEWSLEVYKTWKTDSVLWTLVCNNKKYFFIVNNKVIKVGVVK